MLAEVSSAHFGGGGVSGLWFDMRFVSREYSQMSQIVWAVLILLLIPSSFVFADEGTSKTDVSPLKRLLADAKQKRLDDMGNQVKAIEAAKSALKVAMITDDRNALAQEKKTIDRLQGELLKTINNPISNELVYPLKLKTGQIGRVYHPGYQFKVLQILDKSKGEILVTGSGRETVLLKVVGVDTANLVDGAKFSFPDCMAVVGTFTYKSVGGSDKTIFELHACPSTLLFTENELKPFKEAMDAKYTITLTDAETAKAKSAREAHEMADAERQKVLDAQQRMKDSDAKARRSKSYLDSGKLLLNKGNTAAAKKQFEKAIAEDPESASAKEAKKLLDKNP